MIRKIAFVAHPTRDIGKSRQFFGELLGLQESAAFEDSWVEFDAPDGKTIALDTYSPQNIDDPSVYMALETDDIESEVERLKAAGVKVAMDVWTNEHDGQEICKMAIVLDPDGNPLMLHQIAESRLED